MVLGLSLSLALNKTRLGEKSMAKATFVKKAQKDYPDHDIKKGESYYWWRLMVGGRGGPKQYSKTSPRRSQLTNSEFLGTIYDIEDDLGNLTAGPNLQEDVQDLANRLNELADETEEKFNNMPDGLQQGDTGQMLEERAQGCRDTAEELEGIDFEDDKAESDKEYWDEKLEEIQQVSFNF
jgi:hypothetical protein